MSGYSEFDENPARGPNVVVPSGIEQRQQGFDLIRYLHIFLEKKWLILQVAILVSAGGIYFSWQQENLYGATATFQVNPSENRIVQIEGVAAENLGSGEVVGTIVANTTRSRVFEEAIVSGTLNAFPGYRVDQIPEAPEERSAWLRQRANSLKGKVKAKLRDGTRLVDVRAEHTDPKFAHALANAVMDQVIRLNLEEKMGTNRAANELLLAESEQLKSKLEASERRLLEYQENEDTGALIARMESLNSTVQALNRQYTSDQASRLQIESDLDKIRSYDGDVNRISDLASIRQDKDVIALLTKVTEQQALVNAYTNRYKPKYPKMIRANEELADYKRSLTNSVLQAAARLELAREQILANETKLKAAIEETEAESLDLSQYLIEYNALQRVIDSDKALYESVLMRLKETDLTKGIENNAIIPAERADLPTRPFKPDRQKSAIISIIAGFGLGFGLVFFLNFIDQSVKTVDDAEEAFGLPVLGAIPVDKKAQKQKDVAVAPEEEEEDKKSTTNESFRTALASIRMLKKEEEQRVLMVTSALPSEGKTYSAYNLALNLAKLGHKTVLVDMDLRKPSVQKLHKYFDEVELGISDVLLGRKTVSEVSHPGFHQNLMMIFCGERLPNPVEQLSDRASLTELFRELTRRFDRVVVDTAPVNAVADTLYLQNFSDILCFVVRSRKTPKKVIERGLQSVERAGGRVSGLLLNVLPQRSGYGYYYYYYYNHYGPDGAYGDDPKESRRKKRGNRGKKS